MSLSEGEKKFRVVRAGFAGLVFLSGFSGISCSSSGVESQAKKPAVVATKPTALAQQKLTADLRLKIDEASFWRAVQQGSNVGIITETWDRNKMDCLKPLGDFCIAEASQNFRVGINRPMMDFMFR